MVAGVDGAFELQNLIDVVFDHVAEALENVERELFEAATAFGSGTHRLTDDVVRGAEGHAVTHEVVGEVGGGGEAHLSGAVHDVGLGFDAGHHVAERAQRVLDGVDRVEDGFLVFLKVLVVGKGRTLHEGEHRNEVAVDAPRLAAGGFGNVRVLLLGHDRGARRKAVRKLDEAEALAHPHHEFFGKTRDVHHDERGGRAEFNGKVAVGNAVERVLGNGFEAEEFGREFAVDRVGRTGKRGRAEGAAVDAVTQVKETFAVAFEHFDVGEHVVAERHGLGDLHVREARHDHVGTGLGLVNKHVLEVFDAMNDFVDFGAQIETDVGRHLVVAGAARVEALAGVADKSSEARFDIEMHVFELKLPLERARQNFRADLVHAAADVFEILGGNHADLLEHRRVRDGAFNVRERHALVEVDTRRVAENEGIDRFGETARPRLLLGVQRVVGVVVFVAHFST